MKKFLLIFLPFLFISSYGQNFPVAVGDTAQVMNQDTVAIPVLLNDYDPDGDTIEISYLSSGYHGNAWYEDSVVFYISEWLEGNTSLRYKVAKVNNPAFESGIAYINIKVIENPDVPIIIEDHFHAVYLEPTSLDILANDYDNNGDSFRIDEIRNEQDCEVEISADSTSIIFTSRNTSTGYSKFMYRIREINTSDQYYSNFIWVFVFLDENSNIPIAINDTFDVIGGVWTSLDILQNDINPLNDPLEIKSTENLSNGNILIQDDMIQYKSELSFSGQADFLYTVRNKNKPWYYSRNAEVNINVIKNPGCPVGEPDYGSGMAWNPISVEVLSNDSDPSGDAIEIFDVKVENEPSIDTTYISFSNDIVTYLPPPFITGNHTAYYRIRKVDNHEYFSDWIPIHYEISPNPDFPITINDYASTTAGIPVFIDLIENDIIPQGFENIRIHPTEASLGRASQTDSVLIYSPFESSFGIDSFSYVLFDPNILPYHLAKGSVYINIENNHSYDSLTINNINAGVHSSGQMFNNVTELPEGWRDGYFKPHFEVPKGSGKHTIFSNCIWLGGVDSDGKTHLAAERYRQQGRDFQPGPISNFYDSLYISRWSGLWKLSKEEVEFHKANWWKDGYEASEYIISWPGNGNPNFGQNEQLAPYFDYDNNGIYDPMMGDYPLIRGDECIFFIYNDDRIHTETNGLPMNIEIHGMAYAFNEPEDSILNNSIFVHYDLINRSENTYYDTYFGIWADLEIGYPWDDRIGSSVEGGSYYIYNGLDVDGEGEPGSYGSNPPAQSVTVLAGPFMDPDNEDNLGGGCDYSINGFNFGNGIVDDERLGLTRFTYHNNAGGVLGDPTNYIDYYNSMIGYWKDDTPVIFGGFGHENYGVGPECRFMFPGNSDPQNWGTGCILPNDGYNQNGKWWTEEQIGANPNDKRGMGSCGPFTFHVGDVQEVDLVYIYANSYHGADSSKNLLLHYINMLRQRVLDGEIIIPNEELDVNEIISQTTDIQIYPNPAGDVIYVGSPLLEKAEYRIINSMGVVVKSGIILPQESEEISLSGLRPGFYVLAISSDRMHTSVKFIKY